MALTDIISFFEGATTKKQLRAKLGIHDFEPVSTVANLPTAGMAGRRAFVTDANATTFASIVAGSGANGVPVYDDGTNWRIG